MTVHYNPGDRYNNLKSNLSINVGQYGTSCSRTPSTGETIGSIFTELFGVGTQVLLASMMMESGDRASAEGRPSAGSYINAKIQAQSVIDTLKPQLAELRARYDAANSKYDVEKEKLDKELTKLNDDFGVTDGKTENLTKLREARQNLTTWQANASTYNSNKQKMTALVNDGANSVNTNQGSKRYLDDKGKANKFTADMFGGVSHDPGPSASQEDKQKWERANTAATNAQNKADELARQYKDMADANDRLEKEAKAFKGLDDGENVTDPNDLVTKLKSHIGKLEDKPTAQGKGSCKEYETKKADIEKRLQQLEADKGNTALKARIDAIEKEIADQEMIVAKADAGIAAGMKIDATIAQNNTDISSLKAEKKAAGKRKGFLGIFGKRADKTAYKYYKQQIAAKRAENRELGS